MDRRRFTALVALPRWDEDMREVLKAAGMTTWRESDEEFSETPADVSMELEAESESDVRLQITGALRGLVDLGHTDFRSIAPS